MKLIIFAVGLVGAYAQAPSCGVPAIAPNQDGKIVGGIEAIPNSWPWQVQMCSSGSTTLSCRLRCGGSVINERFILTAAHCTQTSPGSISIKAGSHRIGARPANDNQIQHVAVRRIVNHPEYRRPTQFSNDVSILELATPLTLGSHVSPICIPAADNGNTVAGNGNTAFVTGHGTTRSGGQISEALMQVIVPFVSNEQCGQSYGSSAIDDTMVCLGNFNQGGKDSCQGDSGGPVVKANPDGVFYQYGIVSWGRGCASARFPGVYARVANQCDFFTSAVGSNICVGGN
jgi:secreted trypsin-like serine protease